MAFVQFWILLALVAAGLVLIGASVATRKSDSVEGSSSTWAGLWQNLVRGSAPLILSLRVGVLRALMAMSLVKDPAPLENVRAKRSAALRDRRIDKLVADLAMDDTDTSESNISLDDFLNATQVDGPAYINVVSEARANQLYERYSTRK